MADYSNKYVKATKKEWFLLKDRANSMRNNMTHAESILWNEIRNNKLGVKFRRQVVINYYIADFLSNSANLIIEVDGDSHLNREDYDNYRTIVIKNYGYKIIRFKNEEIIQNLSEVINKIKIEIDSKRSPLP
jgi:histidinol dehydrogenase